MSGLATASVVLAREIDERIGTPSDAPEAKRIREALSWVRDQHYQAFRDQADAAELVAEFTRIVDRVICQVWTNTVANTQCALLAVGGYGRGELLPHSDIDVLLLTPDSIDDDTAGQLESFVRLCWDCGLELGHSVRSLRVCAEEAAGDVTIVTNLMEARHLGGDRSLSDALAAAVGPQQCWPAHTFFDAKRLEQRARYTRFDDTAYKLEPNVKEGPGGLRDLQTILWLTQRLHGTGQLEDLAKQGLLSSTEVSDLRNGRNQLWRVRFALHMISGRCEDRLLFDHQVKIAEIFGYTDQSSNLAVEQFMQLYYRTIKMLSVLNDIFVQLFEEQIASEPANKVEIDGGFAICGHYLTLDSDDAFRDDPIKLLEIFKVWSEQEQTHDLHGLSAQTLRMMRRDRNLIDAGFRCRADARAQFLSMLQAPRGVTHMLRRLNRYGILGRYIPAFGRVVGRMQYDLFHQLTVDEHTLFVVRNIRRFALPEFRHEFPNFSDIHDELERPELLVLAGIFHDIAKGRGGDHSELGSDDATMFCREHGLSTSDQQTVAWLVRNHLLMSLTVQREDVSDPDVINAFVAKLPSHEHLKLLYLLTVCDIRATNPKLWNGFKAGLLRSLYCAAQRSIEEGVPAKEADLIAQKQQSAQNLATELGLSDAQIELCWQRLNSEHLLRHTAEELAWQCSVITHADDAPRVAVRAIPQRGVLVFIHAPNREGLFAATTAVLARLNCNIHEARISATQDGWTADSYAISEADGKDIADPVRRDEIRNALLDALNDIDNANTRVARRLSIREKHFDTPTQIFFRNDAKQRYSVMEMVANDRPGLLSQVGQVLRNHGLYLQSAKVATIGERAEDIFHFSNAQGKPIGDAALFHRLRDDLVAAIADC